MIVLITNFPNVEFAVLSNNLLQLDDLSIKTIPESIWKYLKVLQIQKNELEDIEFIINCM